MAKGRNRSSSAGAPVTGRPSTGERGNPVLGEVVGRDEGLDVRGEALQRLVVEGLHGGLLDGAVHPLGLTVGPGVIRLGQLVRDAVLAADPVEGMPAQPRGWA